MTADGYRIIGKESVVTATIDGPASARDWLYGLDRTRQLFERGSTPGYRAHLHFFSESASHPSPVAIAECAIVLEGSSNVVVAGAVGATMRAAVDDLTARLARRFRDIARRDCERVGAYTRPTPRRQPS
jgi:hypothetical protein